MKGFLAYPVLLTLLIGAPAFVGDEEGLQAGESGEYSTAVKEWKPLAEQGNLKAQSELRTMY